MDIREEIELYAFGKLSGEALRDFEARMAADPAFAAAVARESELLRALRLAPEVDALREQLKALARQQTVPPMPAEKDQRYRMRWYLAAAAVLLALVAAVWLFRQPPAPTPEQLFAAHFEPPQTLLNLRRGSVDSAAAGSGFQQQWNQTNALYARGDFSAALQAWQWLAAQPEALQYQGDLNYAAGLTAMRAGDFKAAIAFLEKIPPGSYPSEKNWNLALCRLRTGEIAAAQKDFEQIAVSGPPHAEAARQILTDLSRR